MPLSQIGEVRQHQSSIRIQMRDRRRQTITVRIGDDLGRLLPTMLEKVDGRLVACPSLSVAGEQLPTKRPTVNITSTTS